MKGSAVRTISLSKGNPWLCLPTAENNNRAATSPAANAAMRLHICNRFQRVRANWSCGIRDSSEISAYPQLVSSLGTALSTLATPSRDTPSSWTPTVLSGVVSTSGAWRGGDVRRNTFFCTGESLARGAAGGSPLLSALTLYTLLGRDGSHCDRQCNETRHGCARHSR